MWLLIIIVGVLFAAPFYVGLLPPPNATTVVRIRPDGIRVTKGRLKPHAKEHVAEILAGVKVTRGFIAIAPDKRVTFSPGVPKGVRQQLRNVLLNQWA